MAIGFCDVASILKCNTDPDDTMFKYLVLLALLEIKDAITASAGGGAGVVLEQVAVPFSSINPVFTDIGLLDVTFKLGRIYVDNQTDANIEISLDGGATVAFTAFAGSSLDRELGAYTASAADDVQIRYQAATVPTHGIAYFDGSY